MLSLSDLIFIYSIALCVYVFGYTVQLGRAYSIATLVRSYYPSELNREGTKGLVQFSDIGKQARDLLFTDYQQGLKASLNFDPYRIRLRSSVDAGGLSGGLVASFPDQSSSKVSLGYVHPNAIANFTTSFGLFRNPLFALSEVVGNHLWSLGFDASFDVTTQSFRSMDFASSLISDKFIASFNSYNRADLLKVYLYQSVMNSAYAVELCRQRSTNTSRISIGYEHRFGSEVLVKSRVDSNGTVPALFQYKWNPGTFYSYNRRADLLKVYLHQSVMNSAYAVELSRQRSTNTNQDLIAMRPWLHYFSTSGIQERFTGFQQKVAVIRGSFLVLLVLLQARGFSWLLIVVLVVVSAVQVLALTEAPEIERKVVVVPGMGSCPRHGSVGKRRFDPLRTGRTLLKE
ncbi:hypothetical protein HID58_068529 [Brassica napus]|uniref:Uncharacterized protein n=1 Tax=Brassica napus TaxID=3708 RepID=A0ABQ7ZLL5_BRANA|nr:hypothetical protein HID58_068529 [Brassica napus]